MMYQSIKFFYGEIFPEKNLTHFFVLLTFLEVFLQTFFFEEKKDQASPIGKKIKSWHSFFITATFGFFWLNFSFQQKEKIGKKATVFFNKIKLVIFAKLFVFKIKALNHKNQPKETNWICHTFYHHHQKNKCNSYSFNSFTDSAHTYTRHSHFIQNLLERISINVL